MGPYPMQLVVVMAVRKAVSAATITFTATSMILPFFILSFFHFFILSFLFAVIAAGTFGEGLIDHLTAHAVLDGDGLHGRGLTQRECLTVEGALAGRRAAVGGVVDLRTIRTTHRHLSRLSKRGVAASVLAALDNNLLIVIVVVISMMV